LPGFSSKRGEERLAWLLVRLSLLFQILSIKSKLLVPLYLEKYRWPIWFFSGRKKIEEYSQTVLEKLKNQIPRNSTITLIGYSMGGLIVRYLVEKGDLSALGKIERIILVGSPNQGIKLSFLKKLLSKRVICVRQMMPGSSFLNELNNVSISRQNYFLIGGSKDKLVPIESALGLPNVPEDQKFILPLSHSELIPPYHIAYHRGKEGAVPKIIQLCQPQKEEAFSTSASFYLQNFNFLVNLK
jgi:hypothetical protein